MIILWMTIVSAYAQKPKWLDNTPKELNYTYKFIEISSTGSSLEAAQAQAIINLKTSQKLLEGIKIQSSTKVHKERDKETLNGNSIRSTAHQHIEEDVMIDGEPFRLIAQKVDEYITHSKGVYSLHTLYAVATTETPVFDNTYVTDRYGVTPVFLSIVPGLGQFYKGSKAKGIFMFTCTSICAGSILLCENLRIDYKNKIKEQPRFAKTYNTKANNWETWRNVSIGAASAMWLYNLIDAVGAKGARRVIVKRPNSRDYSFQLHPYASSNDGGIALSYNF